MNTEQTTNPLYKGAWDNLSSDNVEMLPKITFEMNKPVIVEFGDDFTRPEELPSRSNNDGVYYLFHCKHNDITKIFFTSAWTLLKGLKACEPLARKHIKITKRLIDGKQQYEVIDEKVDPLCSLL